jgi:hypothetical protein
LQTYFPVLTHELLKLCPIGQRRPLRNRMVAAVLTPERAQGSLAGALVAGEPRWSAAGFGSPTSQPHVVFRGEPTQFGHDDSSSSGGILPYRVAVRWEPRTPAGCRRGAGGRRRRGRGSPRSSDRLGGGVVRLGGPGVDLVRQGPGQLAWVVAELSGHRPDQGAVFDPLVVGPRDQRSEQAGGCMPHRPNDLRPTELDVITRPNLPFRTRSRSRCPRRTWLGSKGLYWDHHGGNFAGRRGTALVPPAARPGQGVLAVASDGRLAAGIGPAALAGLVTALVLFLGLNRADERCRWRRLGLSHAADN